MWGGGGLKEGQTNISLFREDLIAIDISSLKRDCDNIKPF